MSIVEQVEKDLVAAMRAQEALKLSVLRMMKAALMNKKVEHGKDVDDAQALAVLRTLAKQRHESVEAFRKGGREELAAKEEAEVKIVEAYLPAGASDEEIDAAVAAAIAASVMAFQRIVLISTSRLMRETQISFCNLSCGRFRSGIDGPYLRDARGARKWIRKKDR